MPFPTISVVNESTVVSDADLALWTEAVQRQINEHLKPIWDLGATLNIVSGRTALDPKDWWLVVLDDSDDADDLGYHEVNPKGQPLGKVFARSDLNCGATVSNTFSHEVLEMLGDPSIVGCTLNSAGTRVYANENCDACEADQFGYTITVAGTDVLVSDFVTPEWFNDNPSAPVDRVFDYGQHCSAPFQVLPGGYCSYMDLTQAGTGWQELTVDGRNIAACEPTGSRLDRRRRFSGTNYRKFSTKH
jgi:hypothetical protein